MKTRLTGFSLIEMIVAVGIASILLAAAVPAFSGIVARTQVRSASSDLILSLFTARSEAMKRNGQVRVSAVTGDWTKGWESYSATDELLESHQPLTNVTVTSGATEVRYLRSGRLVVGTAPQIQIQSKSKSSVVQCVTVDLGGRPQAKEAAC